MFGAALLASAPALGCRENLTLFFSRLPQTIEAPVAVRVTVVRTLAENENFVGIARVEEVLKGSIEAKTIKLFSTPTSCTPGYPVGTSGIIIGTTRRGSSGAIELFPIAGRGH